MEKEFRRPENWLSSPDRRGEWKVHFDDHLGRNLTIRIWDTGLRRAIPDSDQSDISWGYEICAYVTQRVHHGDITGQGDTPPSVEAVLLDWQTDVNLIVVNWARREALNDQ